MAEKIEYTLKKEDEALYIREILQRRLLFSGRLIKKIKYDGKLLLNGEPIKLRERAKEKDLLTIIYPEESSYFEPEELPIEILYEDKDLMVVNKPAGLVVHPTKNYQNGTLANALSYVLLKRKESWKIRFVNRLDRDTSGLLIVAKNAHTQDFLSDEMQKNNIEKIYIALVHGIIKEDGTVNAPIDKDPNHMARRKVCDTGYPSVTHYKVLENFKTNSDTEALKGYTLLELKLDTGRTHQIRVHLTHIGHPLVGDELYGQLYGYEVPPSWMPRQALHAKELSFTQPMTGEKITVKASLPKDMEDAVNYVKNLL